MVLGKAEEVLQRIENMAKRTYLPIIGPKRGQVLVGLVSKLKPKRILEVGTLVGYSTILMGKELGAAAEIVTIEADRDEAEMAERNIQEAEIKPKVRVIVGDASEVIPTLSGEFDLVFLDGAKSEYLNHLRLVEDKLRKGSVVAADNAYLYSMRRYLDYVRNSRKYESQLVRVGGDGVEVSVKL